MTRKLLYILATLALTGCSADVTEGGENITTQGGAIAFSPSAVPFVRASQTGQDAATTLGGAFYVFATKRLSGRQDEVVFKNEKVEYDANGSSLTNTKGWEYAGKSLSTEEATNLTPNLGAENQQTARYWDTNALQYNFHAFAVSNSDLKDGKITVKHEDGKYTVTMTDQADPSKLYFAGVEKNLYDITHADGTPVTFSFSNTMAKVRVAMYSTIQGYTVTLNAFRVADNDNPAFGDMTTETTANFAANLTNHKKGNGGTLEVTYTDGTPVVNVQGDAENVLELGANLKDGTVLPTTSATAQYDSDNGAYTSVFPKQENTQNLKLKVDFTLTANTGETIEVKDATVEVPADYLKWKPGYAYTYIFKITDQVNGTIGKLLGLHAIQLDACTVENGEGQTEVISTTDDGVNIVTAAFDPQTKTAVAGADDYNTGNEVYATVVDNNAIATLSTTNIALYEATTDEATSAPITEASVEAYLKKYNKDNTITDEHVTANPIALTADDFVTKVPTMLGEVSLNALKWTAEKKVYAVEYYNASSSSTTKHYKIVKIDGFNGEVHGEITLSPAAEVENVGGTLTPTLKINNETVDNTNADLTYELASGTPSGITVNSDKTITIAGNTKAGTYTLIARYMRRTYKTTFTVKQ